MSTPTRASSASCSRASSPSTCSTSIPISRKYRLVILPDAIAVSPKLKAKINAYVKGGGRVLLTGMSGIDPERGFVFDVGAKWHGPSPYKDGRLPAADRAAPASFVGDPLFMYEVAERIKVKGGTSLGEIYDPYFDRAPQHFSGHVNTPSEPDPSGYDAGSEKGAFTYLAHPIFTAYKRVGAVAMLEIAEKLIEHALGRRRTIKTSLPRAGRATLRRQAGEEARRSPPAPRNAGAARRDPRRSGPADPGPDHAQRCCRIGQDERQSALGEDGSLREAAEV